MPLWVVVIACRRRWSLWFGGCSTGTVTLIENARSGTWSESDRQTDTESARGSGRRYGAGRLAAGPKRLRGVFPEKLTILTGEPAQMQESPSACDHRHRDRARRVSGQFCTDMVQSKLPQVHHRGGMTGPLERPLQGSRTDPGRSRQFCCAPELLWMSMHQVDRPLRLCCTGQDFASCQRIGEAVGLHLQETLYQKKL